MPVKINIMPSAKYPIPAAMDDVMEVALAKNPNIRTKSVGELATAIGRAYGLEGDHRAWARLPQPELQKLVAQGLARAPVAAQARPAALEAAADPFAAPMRSGASGASGAGGAGGTNPMAPPLQQEPSQPQYPAAPPPQAAPSHPYMQGQAMQHRASSAHDDGSIAGIPGLGGAGGRPPWLIPVVVGIAALVVGGGLAIVLAR